MTARSDKKTGLDQVLTIAAILTNRDPFVAPLEKRVSDSLLVVANFLLRRNCLSSSTLIWLIQAEANESKRRFCPPGFRSDVLAVLKAYNEWSAIPNFDGQRNFCHDNYLSLATLKLMTRVRNQLANSLEGAGVFSLSMGGERVELSRTSSGQVVLPHFMNTNAENLPSLAANTQGSEPTLFELLPTRVFQTVAHLEDQRLSRPELRSVA